MSLPPPGVHAQVDDQGAMQTCTINALSKVKMIGQAIQTWGWLVARKIYNPWVVGFSKVWNIPL